MLCEEASVRPPFRVHPPRGREGHGLNLGKKQRKEAAFARPSLFFSCRGRQTRCSNEPRAATALCSPFPIYFLVDWFLSQHPPCALSFPLARLPPPRRRRPNDQLPGAAPARAAQAKRVLPSQQEPEPPARLCITENHARAHAPRTITRTTRPFSPCRHALERGRGERGGGARACVRACVRAAARTTARCWCVPHLGVKNSGNFFPLTCRSASGSRRRRGGPTRWASGRSQARRRG